MTRLGSSSVRRCSDRRWRKHLFTSDAEALGFDDQLFNLVPRGGCALAAGVGQDDHGADSGRVSSRPSLTRWQRSCALYWIDLEFFAQGADGGNGYRAQLAGDHGFFRRVDDLLEERTPGGS